MTNKLLPVGKCFDLKVLSLFNRMRRHLLIGEVSLETGYSLKVVEHHLDALETRGAIRHLNPSERKGLRLHALTVAFALVEPSLFTTGE